MYVLGSHKNTKPIGSQAIEPHNQGIQKEF